MKKKFTAIKLIFRSPLHIGTGKETYDSASGYLHSDMLSSALCAVRCQLAGATGLDEFRSSYLLSSAFPFMGDLVFLPKPIGRISIRIGNEPEEKFRKTLKKIEFIELTLWEKLIRGEELIIQKEQVIHGKYLIDISQTSNSYGGIQTEVQQRVRIGSNADADPEPYYFERMYFSEGTGLYCLLDSTDSFKHQIIELFRHLGQNGIGTDRSVGNGFFDIETKDIELTFPENATHCMTLSLTVPQKEEIKETDLADSSYQLLTRSGFIAGSSYEQFRHLRKKSICAFAEGSVFSNTKITGKWVDMRPQWDDKRLHPVWRDFRGFSLPVKLIL